MSSLSASGERFPSSTRAAHWHSEQVKPVGFRPAPEGAVGSRANPHPATMCQRSDDVPSYRSLPGGVGSRRMPLGARALGGGCGPLGPASSGGSERKVACCGRCSATLVSLKKQALSLAVHHHFSSEDFSDLSAFLNDNLRIHGWCTSDSRDREREPGQCDVCGSNPDRLKQEAIHLALNRGQTLTKSPFEANLSTGSLLGQYETKLGDRSQRESPINTHLQRSQTCSPHSQGSPRTPQKTPQRTPQTLRRKAPNHDMDRWLEQQTLAVSKSASGADGVTSLAYHKAADDALLSCNDVRTLQTSSKIPHISRVVNIANTAAMSFLARAAEKLNLTLKKKGQASGPAPSTLSTCFMEIIQKNPPPVPSCLLQAVTRSKDSLNVGKVKVVLRVSPTLSESQPPVLRIDPLKKRVTIMEPSSKSQHHASTMTLGRGGKNPLKTFNFDTAFPQDSSQAEVCSGVLTDVIRCVLSGSDGCVLGLGSADVGSWSSMVGSGESIQKLGVIPCAISWLYNAIERRREKTWTDLSVSVSAIELCCGEEDTLRDLLGEVVPSLGSIQDSPKAHVRVQEDPVYGIQLRNYNRVKALTAERAASLLDVAIAARRHSDFVTYLSQSSIMFFTLHVQPPRTESSTIGKGCRGPTKLTLIDVCSGMRSMNKCKPCHSELGPIVLSLLNGHKTTPSRGSKLSMLLRESLGHANCHIAVMADVGDSRALLQETFATIQLASRIRRTQKRTKQSTSCSPCGRSLTRQKKGPQSLSLRAFHSTDEVDVDTRPFRLRGDLDERSSSDQSCDTVIQIDLEGLAHSKVSRRPTQPEFVPIIPSLHPNKTDLDDPEFNALLQELLRIPQLKGEKKSEEASQVNAEGTARTQSGGECLKCDTFAELQERLGCIDGSEIAMDLLKSSLNGASFNNVAAKLHQSKESGKQQDTEASVPQAVLNQGLDCKQSSAKEKLTDGAFLGDSFQREDSGLYDCEECSANSSSEEPLNQTLRNCRSTPKPGNEQDVDSAAQSKAPTSSFASQPSQRQDKSEAVDWFKPDKRTSPVGKSSPSSLSTSCTSSPPLAKSVVLGDVLPQRPTSDVKDMKATITVTVKQPLDLKGQDEIVFSMVEEVTISGAYDRGGAGGSIICIRDPAQSQEHVHSNASSQPVRIISNISEESEATVSSNETQRPVAQPGDARESTGNPKYPLRREKGFLPSFINPMLMNTAVDCELDDVKVKEGKESTAVKAETESKRKDVVNLQVEKVSEKRSGASETSVKKVVKKSYSLNDQDIPALEDVYVLNSTENKMCDRRLQNKDAPRDCRHVYSTNTPKIPEEVQPVTRLVGNTPNRIGASPSCQETTLVFSKTSSLPRGWLNTNHQQLYQSCHTANNHKDPRGVTSSASSSPGVTLERRQVRQPLPVGHAFHVSSPQKHGTEFKQGTCGALKMCAESMFETLSPSLNHPLSPTWESGRFFSAKLEQISSRTNSLGRMPRDFSSLERGSSNSSVSSKGSIDGTTKTRCKGSNDGECTLPRASRSPRRNPRPDQGHHFFPSENIAGHSVRHNHSKLSAVGKLKITTPKVRRLSAPSIKNLNIPHKNVQHSNNRSASLSPDGKAVSYERTSSFFSSSPPRSFRSISRTPSQSSSCSSTKSAIHGFVNGRIADLLKETVSGSTSGPDQLPLLPSPYSQMTAPRISDYSNGHASDTTSVLSGDLPPAMGKTSLYFSNRSSLVSSGYDSMLRDSEATCTSRDSVSDRSGSVLSVSRSSRSSRRRGTTGVHPRRVSQDAPTSLRRSTSGLKSRWMDRGIPEAYEITVYEIDNMQRKQKKSGAKHHAEGFGASAAEGLRGVTRILPEEKSRDGQTQPQAGARHLDPRPRPVADMFRGLPGAPGGP